MYVDMHHMMKAAFLYYRLLKSRNDIINVHITIRIHFGIFVAQDIMCYEKKI
jgi:hypothetical protein